MMNNNASSVLWRRLLYMLTPQLDIYENVRKVVDGRKVLEVGFGTGIGVLQYSAQAEYVDAVELDEAAVEFARKVFPLRNVRWLHDDITKPNRYFRGYDLVLAVEVLEHIEALDGVMRTLYAAMAPNGAGLFTVPNEARYRRRREGLNVREWTPEAFVTYLTQFFPKVWVLDTTLQPWVTEDVYRHRESPIVVGVNRCGR
jgi:2-polyprenyl-3-methyl-5-hydroxy-6-metoxy-1,4-benzoquinol methylase